MKPQSDDEGEEIQPSLFRKVNNIKSMDLAADSATVEEAAIKKANLLLSQHNIFNKLPLTGGNIQPLNNIKLKQKER